MFTAYQSDQPVKSRVFWRDGSRTSIGHGLSLVTLCAIRLEFNACYRVEATRFECPAGCEVQKVPYRIPIRLGSAGHLHSDVVLSVTLSRNLSKLPADPKNHWSSEKSENSSLLEVLLMVSARDDYALSHSCCWRMDPLCLVLLRT